MTDPVVVVHEQPQDTDRKAILDALLAFNERAVSSPRYQPLAILIRDPVNGETLGGLWGKTAYDWLFVELLVVPEQFRGQDLGSRLLAMAEETARQRGCVGAWLDTFAFQAPGFYQKLGYEIFGKIDDHPRGSRRFFLKKRFQ